MNMCLANFDQEGHAIKDLYCQFCGEEQSACTVKEHETRCRKRLGNDDDQVHSRKRTQKEALSDSQSKKQKNTDSFEHLFEKEDEKTDGVYVLQLDDGFIYVGRSNDMDARIEKHKNFSGAQWCKKHGTSNVKRLPTQTPRQPDLSLWEQKETLYQMHKHGFEKVRGYMWVQDKLQKEDIQTIRKLTFEEGNLCRKCGLHGHYATSCCTVKDYTAKWIRNLNALLDKTDTQSEPKENKAPISFHDMPQTICEVAKSGRSTCRTCNKKIADKTMRHGTLRLDGKSPYYEWRHTTCVHS